jgi:hypothetical protein
MTFEGSSPKKRCIDFALEVLPDGRFLFLSVRSSLSPTEYSGQEEDEAVILPSDLVDLGREESKKLVREIGGNLSGGGPIVIVIVIVFIPPGRTDLIGLWLC